MSNKKKDGGGSGGGWQNSEDDIMAVIIADSFNRMFSPITYETPRALLPLGNGILLDYSIEYLLDQGINNIVIFCCSHGEKIREYVRNKLMTGSFKHNIQFVMSSTSDCISFGDALREIDREGLVLSDFVLLHGDVISNIPLMQLIKEHKEKRKVEKNLVMTTLHRVSHPSHFSRCQDDDVMLAIDPSTNRILHWQKYHKTTKFHIALGKLGENLTVRSDLSPCHIYICSPQVGPLFTDNFDYQTLDDFVKGILMNEEIMGDQIHCHVIEKGYSSRVNDLHMYNAMSLDFLNQWMYPIVPKAKITKRNNVYLENNVHIGKNVSFGHAVLIGENTKIGDNVKITKSVIGKNCNIGSLVSISNSYIWDECTLEDDVDVVQTLICNKSLLKRGVKMIDALISFGVVVDSGQKLNPSTRLSLIKPDSDFNDEFADMAVDEKTEYNTNIVGENGKGYVWPVVSDEEDDVYIPSLSGNNYDGSSDDDESDDDIDETPPPSPTNEVNNLYQFQMEVLENLRHGIQEGVDHNNIALEINASKFKLNITIPELCTTVMTTLLKLSVKSESATKQEIVKEFEKISSSLCEFLLKYYDTAESQMCAIQAVEEYVATTDTLHNLFATIIHKMYEKDILNENLILHWYKKPPSHENQSIKEKMATLRKNENLQKFITWLEEAEEDSDDDDDDESD